MKNITTLLLIVAIVLMANVLAKQFFFRWDLTQDKQYTLSSATKDILKNLEEPVTVTAYFTEGLPPEYAKVRRDFQDLLVEYANASKGYVDYEFINPNDDPELEQQLMQKQIPPILFNVREKDQLVQKKGYMASTVQLGEREEVMPIVQSSIGMEYNLTTNIKKLSNVEKPSIALVQGHGEPAPQDLAMVFQSLGVLYNVETLNLANEASIPAHLRAVALVSPSDSIPPAELAKLDAYLAGGGDLFIAINRVQGDFSTAQGTALNTGLESWLASKGLIVDPAFVVDESCGTVGIQQKRGFLTFQTPVPFPYLPLIKTFPEHPITKGIEQVMMPFASPIRFSGDSSARFTPIAQTGGSSGSVNAPTFFDVTNKRWTKSDFPMSNLIVGAILEGRFGGDATSRIILFSDGDFPASDGQRIPGQTPDNVSLMVNSIDWLSDDTGLIALRTKGAASRPIDDLEEGERSWYKYLNFFLPILLVIFYGIYRMQRRKGQRMRRMQQRYT